MGVPLSAFSIEIVLILVFFLSSRPKFLANDGHLIIESAANRNISFHMVGNGYVNINDVNLLRVLEVARNMSSPAAAPGNSNLADFNTRFTRLTRRVTRIENRSVHHSYRNAVVPKRGVYYVIFTPTFL